MGFIRLVVFGLLGLSVIYLCLSVYSRSVRREKLEKAYDADPVAGMTRREYVDKGIVEYNNSLRPKLLLLVYIIWKCVKGGVKATDQVWDGAKGLEFTVPSPAPYHTFEEPPVVK